MQEWKYVTIQFSVPQEHYAQYEQIMERFSKELDSIPLLYEVQENDLPNQ
jgi:hypothetical protein